MGKKLGFWGALGTIAYLSLVCGIVFFKRTELCDLKLNELGDFLAGVFGPVAFLWLVLGFLQQGRELKVSSEALKLQAEELRKSVEQQTELVGVSREQYKIQLEVLEAEKQAKLAALEPKLLIEASYPGFKGNQPSYDFIIQNSGANCFKLEGTAFVEGQLIKIFSIPLLKTDGSAEFKLVFRSVEAIQCVNLKVSFNNELGVGGTAEFVLLPDGIFPGYDAPYFTVTKKI